jgi:hypothetical protein
MHTRHHSLLVVAVSAFAVLSTSTAFASAIDVPAGNELEHSFTARGVQIYDCVATPTGAYAWTFRAPEATLFNREGEIVAHHYGGPTWESTKDGSKIQGTRMASEPSMTTGAIPQLLLSATVLATGRTFGHVTYIQRVNTVGGSAPASGCDATSVGGELQVPYTASYRFYKKD